MINVGMEYWPNPFTRRQSPRALVAALRRLRISKTERLHVDFEELHRRKAFFRSGAPLREVYEVIRIVICDETTQFVLKMLLGTLVSTITKWRLEKGRMAKVENQSEEVKIIPKVLLYGPDGKLLKGVELRNKRQKDITEEMKKDKHWRRY